METTTEEPKDKPITIAVKPGTRERLRNHGSMGESFDDVINNILTIVEDIQK